MAVLAWMTALVAGAGAGAAAPERVPNVHVPPALPVGVAATADHRGFWVASANGVVTPEGDAPSYGDLSQVQLTQPIVSIATSVGSRGYWLIARDGGVFSFGNAHFYGSTGGVHLAQPIVGAAADPVTGGYWMVASDGGVFSFRAPFLGSMGGHHLNRPIVGLAATPDGKGYWEVASDGGIFAFGDARFYGSTGAVSLAQPIVGMAATPDGKGYWLIARDGGIFPFGDAPFLGSGAGSHTDVAAVGLTPTGTRNGYWIAWDDGQVQSFGRVAAPMTLPVVSTSACAANLPGRQLIDVSITDQQLWACEGSRLVNTTPVTTGAVAVPGVLRATPTGTWQIQGKTTDVDLIGCDALGCWDDHVNYWMPFSGAYGLHDAPWQNFPYGSPLYTTQGSHGCVHLPEYEMSWMYDWAPVGTTVTVTA